MATKKPVKTGAPFSINSSDKKVARETRLNLLHDIVAAMDDANEKLNELRDLLEDSGNDVNRLECLKESIDALRSELEELAV